MGSPVDELLKELIPIHDLFGMVIVVYFVTMSFLKRIYTPLFTGGVTFWVMAYVAPQALGDAYSADGLLDIGFVSVLIFIVLLFGLHIVIRMFPDEGVSFEDYEDEIIDYTWSNEDNSDNDPLSIDELRENSTQEQDNEPRVISRQPASGDDIKVEKNKRKIVLD